MPKSSSDEPHAERRAAAPRVARRGSASSISALSVISSDSAAGSMPVVGEHRATVVDEVGVRELARRQVDRARVSVGAVGSRHSSAATVAHASAQHPLADRHDQARLLGDRDESPGATQAALGVLPAHERLDADDRAASRRSTIGW